ncbi:hypothetical protein ONA70_33705 [Micromonospora yasonensis]|uniref:DUF6541 family protein n=1 Tax=Micromonospora yasonensis TaxID=1128667 RepID=UPI0022304A1A|nr:DUF6541 family protein [Micromonospora yasonensis]MCW3845035.1 hypothetical protein [Micromonospora yasonensis]
MLAGVVALVVAVVPGALLGFVLSPGRYRWAAWTAAPALTLGLASVAMGWLPALGLPHSAMAVLVAEVILAGAAILASRLVARGLLGDEHGEEPSRLGRFRLPAVRPRRADVIGVVVPAVVNVGFGWLMLGRFVAPAGWDAMHHGYFSRRILETGSATISSACSASIDSIPTCEFYPVATNVLWAQAAQLSGGHLSAAMTTWSVLVGPLALVAGVYAVVRVLRGGPVVAACAAVAPAFVGPFWFSAIVGRITQLTGPCMAVGIALLIALAVRGPHPVRIGLLAGLASAGLIMSHTYDILLAGVLALGLLPLLPGRLALRRSLAGAGSAAVAGVVAFGPFLSGLTGAKAERASYAAALPGQFGKAFDFWVTDPQRYVLFGFPSPAVGDSQLDVPTIRVAVLLTLACLVAAPLCLVFRQLRWARPWLFTGVVFTAVGIWTTMSNSPSAALVSGLWYGSRERLRLLIFPVYGLLTVAGAVAVGLAVQWLLGKLVDRATALRESSAPAAVAASVVVLSLTILAAVPASWRPLRNHFKSLAPVDDSYRGAFRWLAANTPPGRTVAVDRRHYLAWLYVDYGVPELFGVEPVPAHEADYYTGRLRAWDWLVDKKGAQPGGCDVRRFAVEYLVVGGGLKPFEGSYDPQRVAASNRLVLAHQVGTLKVYRVTDAGRACPTAG